MYGALDVRLFPNKCLNVDLKNIEIWVSHGLKMYVLIMDFKLFRLFLELYIFVLFCTFLYIFVPLCTSLYIFILFCTSLNISIHFCNFVRKTDKIHSNVQNSTEIYRNSQKFTEIHKKVQKRTPMYRNVTEKYIFLLPPGMKKSKLYLKK